MYQKYGECKVLHFNQLLTKNQAGFCDIITIDDIATTTKANQKMPL